MKKKSLRLRIVQEKEIIQKMQDKDIDLRLSGHPKAYHEGRLSILEEIQLEQTLEYMHRKMIKSVPNQYQCPVCETSFRNQGEYSLEEYICPKCGWTLTNTRKNII